MKEITATKLCKNSKNLCVMYMMLLYTSSFLIQPQKNWGCIMLSDMLLGYCRHFFFKCYMSVQLHMSLWIYTIRCHTTKASIGFDFGGYDFNHLGIKGLKGAQNKRFLNVWTITWVNMNRFLSRHHSTKRRTRLIFWVLI